MSQRQPLVTSNQRQAFLDDKSATSSAEEMMHEQVCDLANRLHGLLENILLAGFDKELRQLLQECFQLYFFKLAPRLWEEVAANRHEELACDEDYHKAREQLEQQISYLLNRCKTGQEPHASVKRRGKWRLRLYQRALDEWKTCLGKDPATMLSDPTKSGRILYHAQSCLGLASCNRFDYVLIKSLQIVTVLASLSGLLAIISIISPSEGGSNPSNLAGALAILSTSAYLLWFTTAKISLSVMMGYTLVRRQTPDAVRSGPGSKASFQSSSPLQLMLLRIKFPLRALWNKRPRLPGFLRGWLRFWGIVEGVGLPALLLLITFSDIGTGWYSGLDLIAAIIGGTAVLYWVLGFPLIVLPFTLTMQARMRKELIAYPKRPPEVRRSAISPIMKVLSFHTIFFTFLLLMIAEVVLLFIPAGLPFLINFTWQGFMGFLFLVMLPIVLLYVLCLERPYRRSLRNWKTSQLAELTNLRKKFERLLREASSPLPVEKDPLSLQENYALWQFYCALEEDVKQASPAPFSFLHRGGAALLTLASGILVAYLSSNLNNLIHVMQQTPGH